MTGRSNRGGERAGAGRAQTLPHDKILARAGQLKQEILREREDRIVDSRYELPDDRSAFTDGLKRRGIEDRRLISKLHVAFEAGTHDQFLDELVSKGVDASSLEGLIVGWEANRHHHGKTRRRSLDPNWGVMAEISRRIARELSEELGVSVRPRSVRQILDRKF